MTAELFLSPIGCYFQVVGFGSDFQNIFSRSTYYDSDSLRFASYVVDQWSADLGGTEILEPLQAVYDSWNLRAKERKVIVITGNNYTSK